MSSAPFDTAPRPAVEYVGFGLRLVASLIDLGLVLFIVVPQIVWWFGDGWAENEGLAAFTINWILPGVAVVVFWRARGATPGKMAVSAVIVDAGTLDAPTTAQLIGRYAAYHVSAIPLFAGFLWVVVDARKQGWHDKMANTAVIRRRR